LAKTSTDGCPPYEVTAQTYFASATTAFSVNWWTCTSNLHNTSTTNRCVGRQTPAAKRPRKLSTRLQARGPPLHPGPTRHRYQSNQAAASLARGLRKSSRYQTPRCGRAATQSPPNHSKSPRATARSAMRSQQTRKKTLQRTVGGGTRSA
jgi:hypothetical protein